MKLTQTPRLRHIFPGCIAAVLLNFAACSSDPETEGIYANASSTASTTGGLPGTCTAPTQPCSGGCADFASDPSNCGACGLPCVVGQSCLAGVCTSTCTAGQVTCGTSCVDVTANALHCGACNSACAAGQLCQGSVCVAGSCAVGQTLCAGACVNTTADNLNCGACGNPCLVGQTCQAGVCVAVTCPVGQALCAGVCTDLATVSNCGGCGLVCATGQTCSAGVCSGTTTGTLTTGGLDTTVTSTSTTGTTVTATATSVTVTSATVTTATVTSATVTTATSTTATSTTTDTTATSSTTSTTTSTTGAGGATSSTTSTESSTTGSGTDTRPWFSFFVTSLPGLQGECGTLGCGGDLGGLSGADAICTRLAQQGNPGDTKTWHAFLSATGEYGDMVRVDAIDRVGTGPWWDWHGRMLAPDVQSLLSARPSGGDASLRVMFVDETGTDIQSARNGLGAESPDNHDSLTGSGDDGRLADGAAATCQDWTSSTLQGSGEIPVGHAWPRQAGTVEGNGANWIEDHTVNGCEPSVEVGQGGGACSTCFGVGDGGGFGGFYCFALNATAP